MATLRKDTLFSTTHPKAEGKQKQAGITVAKHSHYNTNGQLTPQATPAHLQKHVHHITKNGYNDNTTKIVGICQQKRTKEQQLRIPHSTGQIMQGAESTSHHLWRLECSILYTIDRSTGDLHKRKEAAGLTPILKTPNNTWNHTYTQTRSRSSTYTSRIDNTTTLQQITEHLTHTMHVMHAQKRTP